MPDQGPVGFIADDITGATDQASALSRRGFDTRLTFGNAALERGSIADAGAVVVALKIRSVPAIEARRAATDAATALKAVGATRLFSKYCSTFDSTPEGNIGPDCRRVDRGDPCSARRPLSRPIPRTAGRSTSVTCSSAISC